MNAFKPHLILSCVLIILFASLVTADEPAMLSPSQVPAKTFARNRLLDVARSQGYVKVMVQFSVADIHKLTAASTAFGVVAPGEKAPDKAREADAMLTDRITTATNDLLSNLQGTDHKVNHTYETIPFVALDASEQSLLILESLPEVVGIAEDRLVPLPQPVPEVRENRESSSRGVSVGVIGADKAWQMGYTGAGWYVAILDTGIRRTHEFFAGKTIVEACYSSNSSCPNGQTSMTGLGSAAPYPSTYATYDHGTHVAGIAAGKKADNSILGVAKDANIIAIQVYSKLSASQCGGAVPCIGSYDSDEIAALQYIYYNRSNYSITSVNMSLGGGKFADQNQCDTSNAAIKAAIDNLRSVGIATIIASGNDGYCDGISAPGCISTAISIGATTDADVETSFSNWNPNLLDLFAPGYQINSSIATSDTSYGLNDGTSMAAPHVTGAFAILKQKYPGGSVTELLTAVQHTGVQVTTRCGTGLSKPRIKVDSAIVALSPPSPVPKTGQTTSYGVRDDGALQAGVAWPNPRFTDNNNGTVTDNLTGLIWLKNANCFGLHTWTQALADANGLANGNCGLSDGSHIGDWRLPNINELKSLVDYSQPYPTIQTGHPFTGVQLNDYLSSTTLLYRTSEAWIVCLIDGSMNWDTKTYSRCVWPVRGGQSGSMDTLTISARGADEGGLDYSVSAKVAGTSYSAPVPKTGQTTSYGTRDDGALQMGVAWPTPRFTDNNDGTVTDNLSGLIWLKNANCFSTQTWTAALVDVNGLANGNCGLTDGSYAGDWRLPNV
ncbi:MAG: S8 family serine peptidase, partial [Deltaproteobacteria bacterium]|nr:S8 family serine peptidase [Deltaproteobacteria bacterium]